MRRQLGKGTVVWYLYRSTAGILDLSIPHRCLLYLQARHRAGTVYYPSIITQEYYLLARVRVIRPRRLRADRRLRVVEVVVVDVEAVIQ